MVSVLCYLCLLYKSGKIYVSFIYARKYVDIKSQQYDYLNKTITVTPPADTPMYMSYICYLVRCHIY